MEPYSFDLQRIFFGDLPLAFLVEIVFRTGVLFFYLLLSLRFIGQRSIGQITMFEFAVIIALGSAAGDPMFYPDVPLLHGMVVITMIVIFQRLLVNLTRADARAERFVEGKTERIVIDGCLDLQGIDRSLLSREEVYMELRQHGIEQLGQVRRAYLEIDGQVSIFVFDGGEIRAGLPLLPPEVMADHTFYEANSPPPENGLYACYNCGSTQRFDKTTRLIVCPRCHKRKWIAASKAHIPENQPG